MDPVAREKKGFAQRVGYDTQKATAPRKSTVSAQGARAQRSEALGRSGTWKQAAKHVAGAHEQEHVHYLPPAYAALNFPSCLKMSAQMYECLEKAEWATCVVCRRAWYDLPPSYTFEDISSCRASSLTPRF